MDEDLALALQLQAEYDAEQQVDEVSEVLPAVQKNGIKDQKDQKDLSPVDPQWEVLDPSPDVRAMFIEFNQRYFWGKLDMVEVRWSPRMTLCAGLCVYEGRGGLCSVRLSAPLLKLRPRKDLVETLLHEMIHALLFVTQNNKDHDGHGPEFQKHMHRINKDAGSSISIYHNFHDEVNNYRTHWWKCDGPCVNRPPYFGMVKRAMNRAPSARDPWWPDHQRTCGGTYNKVKEPEGYGQKKSKAKDGKNEPVPKPKNSPDIRNFMNGGAKLGSKNENQDDKNKDNSKKKKGGGIQVFAGSGEEGASTSNAGDDAVPSWRPAPVTPTKSFDIEKTGIPARTVDAFSGEGVKLGSNSRATAGSASGSGEANRVITRRIPGFGIITSERYNSPTKQSDGGGNIPGRSESPMFTTPSNTSGNDKRKRKSVPVELDVSDNEDYLPKAKHRRTNSVEFSVDTPPGSLVSVPGFRSVCTGHSSDRRHMNSVAIDHAKSKSNSTKSKSADGTGVKGRKKTTNNGDRGDKKRPKRITNVDNYAKNRNARVLMDSSDSDSDDEEFKPLISASRKTVESSPQKKNDGSDPDWEMELKERKVQSDSDHDSVIMEDPLDLPYKMKFPDSPVKPKGGPIVIQDGATGSFGDAYEIPGGSAAPVPSSQNAEELVDCPACTAQLPMSQINAHLDACLA